MREQHAPVPWHRLAIRAAGATMVAGLLALPSPAATLDSPERWDAGTAAGWMRHDLINESVDPSLTVENGSLKLVFARQSISLPPEEYVLEAGTNSSSGKFSGDYLRAGVTAISFRLYCECPAEVSALLWSERTHRLWRYSVPGIRTGEWMSVSVPIALARLKSVNGVEGALQFEEDLQDVSRVGVAIRRYGSLQSQVYRLDDFALSGTGSGFSAWMAQFARPPQYGEGACNSLPEGDLDGDGVCNADEWISGTSAGDESDFFALTVENRESASAPGGRSVVLKWKAAPGRRYSVWRATEINGGFTRIRDQIDATPPLNEFEDLTATNREFYLYRSEVQWPGL